MRDQTALLTTIQLIDRQSNLSNHAGAFGMSVMLMHSTRRSRRTVKEPGIASQVAE